MVLYFSGTGNSKYVAEKIAQSTNDEIVSINDLIKNNNNKELTSTNSPYVFVCPTYAWRIPLLVEKFIYTTTFKGNNKVNFILTCGEDTQNAIGQIRKLCKRKQWELQGFAEIIMPNNYVAFFTLSDEITTKKILEDSTYTIKKVSHHIKNSDNFSIVHSCGIIGKMQSSIINIIFYKMFINAKGFHVSDNCIGCKKCARLCPLNNINIIDSTPVWGNKCTHCMACISGCPTQTIEYKNKTQGKARYYLT